MSPSDLLANIPTAIQSVDSENWVMAIVPFLQGAVLTETSRESFVGLPLAKINQDNELFLKAINAAFLADWACYESTADRADFERLRSVIEAFPAGFCIWFCDLAATGFYPVGYTGWYPIASDTFRRAYDAPETITHRRELWPTGISPTGNFIWLFNYSILRQFRRQAQSRLMLQKYAYELSKISIAGLAAAVLSAESVGVVSRFGMKHRGVMTHDGASEDIYAVKFDT